MTPTIIDARHDAGERSEQAAPERRRLSGLDGLRAVAVLAVVFFHLSYSLLPGGFLGVDLFFVISGFLITNLIATEILTNGRLRLGQFYRRRAWRLLPTVLAVLVVVAVASATVWTDQLATLRGAVVSTLGYVTNWWLIADHQSYFVSSGRPSMLQHLWSLAIEEQFYVVWSLLIMALAGVLIARHRGSDPARRMRLVVLVAVGLALLSTALMAWIAIRSGLPYQGSTSRVYFGSDTHSMGLFLGSAAGAWLALRQADTPRHAVPGRARRNYRSVLTDLVGAIALVVVVAQFFRIDEFSPDLYRGGFLAFDAIALVAVMCAASTGSVLGRVLDVRPLKWIGQRSYSIYVWHWPVIVVTRPGLDVHGPVLLIDIARLALIFALAALSYRYIEQPLRRGGYRQWHLTRPKTRRRSVHVVVAAGVLAAASVVLAACSQSPTVDTPAGAASAASIAPVTTSPAAPTSRSSVVAPSSTTARGSSRTHVRGGVPLPGRVRSHAPAGDPGVTAKPSLSAFGDSVLLGAQADLQQRTARLQMDAVEGRQANDVLDDVSQRAAAGTLEPDVLIHVGDNGIISPDQLDHTLSKLSDRRRVLLFTVRVPRDWQDPNNSIIHRMAEKHANVVLVDWHALSGGHSSWLYSDGIHLTPNGRTAYAQIVLKALGNG